MTTPTRLVADVGEIDVANVAGYGGKAAGLGRMAAAGIPIPPAFVISTEGFHLFRANGGGIGPDIMDQARSAIGRLETTAGKRFAGNGTPLLVSVRSGAAISMPGMMDTILNLGLTADSAHGLAVSTGRPEFVVDTWIRFWRMFSDTVLGLDPDDLVDTLGETATRAQKEVSRAAFRELEDRVIAHIGSCGEEVSRNPIDQLQQTIEAIFRSWESPRAKAYREHHGISDDLGTAVTVQAMVFGNADENSGSGVAFTRNPNDGTNALYGEYLVGRQGEDLVAGTHTPIDLSQPESGSAQMRGELERHGRVLERLYGDAVDIEFTVESGTLYLLQVRAAKRTAAAAVRIAEDLVDEGLIGEAEAVRRVSVQQVRKLLKPEFDRRELEEARCLSKGLGSSPGQAAGRAVLDSDRAAELAGTGEDVILVRPTTSPQDIRGMLSSNGIITATGGSLSHAAVVSRALDKPCIVGCENVDIDPDGRVFAINGEIFDEGAEISIDGTTGEVFESRLSLKTASGSGSSLDRIFQWADDLSGAEIWAAPKTEDELVQCLGGGPPGIGVIGLTDLIISNGTIEEFADLILEFSKENQDPAKVSRISEITCQACAGAFAAALGKPVHIRLPQINSERARGILEYWAELPNSLFLPLGSPGYNQALITGISDAARGAGHRDVSVLVGGIVDMAELVSISAIAESAGNIRTGAVIQNLPALIAAKDWRGARYPVWIDINEIIRTAYGFPAEIKQSPSTLDEYEQAGNIARNPYRQPFALVGDSLEQLLVRAETDDHLEIGVNFTSEILQDMLDGLYRIGFRRFSMLPSRRDENRVSLGHLPKG